MLAHSLSKSIVGILIIFDGDRVLTLTNVKVAERVVRDGHAFDVIGSLEKIERVLQIYQRLIRFAALQKNSTLLERIGSLPILRRKRCRSVRCPSGCARAAHERTAGDDC